MNDSEIIKKKTARARTQDTKSETDTNRAPGGPVQGKGQPNYFRRPPVLKPYSWINYTLHARNGPTFEPEAGRRAATEEPRGSDTAARCRDCSLHPMR